MKKAQKSKPKNALAKARALAAKGFSANYRHDGIWVLLTPDNLDRSLDELAAERRAHDAAHEAKFKNAWKCKCASHYPDGDLTKPRKGG
jgi:hypothetical protein